MDSAPVEIVILAAGESRRFGGVKALAPVAGGAMLQQVLDKLRGIPGTVLTVVLGAHREAIENAVDFTGTKRCVNLHWEEGMASSIRCAVRHGEYDAAALLFIAGDQAALSREGLEEIIRRWRGDPDRIVAAAYNGQQGIPAIFPRRFWSALANLDGDKGAKSLLRDNPADVVAHPMPEAGVDIDTRDDLARFTEAAGSPTDDR